MATKVDSVVGTGLWEHNGLHVTRLAWPIVTGRRVGIVRTGLNFDVFHTLGLAMNYSFADLGAAGHHPRLSVSYGQEEELCELW